MFSLLFKKALSSMMSSVLQFSLDYKYLIYPANKLNQVTQPQILFIRVDFNPITNLELR